MNIPLSFWHMENSKTEGQGSAMKLFGNYSSQSVLTCNKGGATELKIPQKTVMHANTACKNVVTFPWWLTRDSWFRALERRKGSHVLSHMSATPCKPFYYHTSSSLKQSLKCDDTVWNKTISTVAVYFPVSLTCNKSKISYSKHNFLANTVLIPSPFSFSTVSKVT